MTGGAASCEGSALAFARFLHEQGIPVVWAYRDDAGIVPSWATPVRAGTARHRWLAARSRWWLTDGLPMRVSGPDTVGRPLERGRDTRVVAFVEPSVERVGSDVVDWPLYSHRRQRMLQARSETDVDLVVVPSTSFGARQAHALGFTAPCEPALVLLDGVPDRLVARGRLGVADGDAVVGVLLDHSDPTSAMALLTGVGGLHVIVVGDEAAAPDVIGASDVLVCDTSGWAAVAARRGCPIVVFAPDVRDLLSRGPGLYLSWQRDAPGPLVSTPQEVRDVVLAVRDADWTGSSSVTRGHQDLADLAGAPSGATELLSMLEGRA